jgi:hypothetical protein
MAHISDNYAAKLAIAEELVRLGARAITITAVARIKPADSRAKFRQIYNRSSQTGQTPTDHDWFLTSKIRRQHGAALLFLYAKYRQSLQSSPDALGLAVTLAYRVYLRVTNNNPEINIERFTLLVNKGFSIGWTGILSGKSSNFTDGNIKLLQCKKCKISHLVEAHFISYVCQSCHNK